MMNIKILSSHYNYFFDANKKPFAVSDLVDMYVELLLCNKYVCAINRHFCLPVSVVTLLYVGIK